MDRTPAHRLYCRRIAIATAAYVAAVTLAACTLGPAKQLPGLPHVLALASALPAAAFFWIMGVYLRDETDEYRRLLEARKCLIATGFMLSIVTAYGFLEMYRLAPHVPFFFVGPLWFLGLIPGGLYNRVADR